MNTKSKSMLEAALFYLKQGFSVVPTFKNKSVPFEWGMYKTKRPSEYEVRAWYKQWPDANVAIIAGKLSNIMAIDVDDMQKGWPAINEALPDSIIAPIVETARGRHIWFQHNPDIKNISSKEYGIDVLAKNKLITAPPSIHKSGKQYAFLKGLHIKQVSLPVLLIENLKFLLESMCKDNIYSKYNNNINNNIIYNKNYFFKSPQNSLSLANLAKKSSIEENQGVTSSMSTKCPQNFHKCPQKPPMSTNVHRMFQQGSRDNDLFHTANCLIKGDMHPAMVMQVLEILAGNCEPPFPVKEIPAKIQSALNRAESRLTTLADEVKHFVLNSEGMFTIMDVLNELGVSSRVHRKNISEILRRLIDESMIERHGGKYGQFRRIEDDFQPLKTFDSEDTEPIELVFPLGIEQYGKFYQTNILVVAGDKSAGKTAFALEFATLNMDKHKIRYISSEFGAAELLNRLEKMDVEPEQWIKKIEFGQYMKSNMHDAIHPNRVNIVDFLEVEEGKFYMIGEQIKKCYQKLKKGICLVLLQKKRGNDRARGGDLTAEKARLYVTLGRYMINDRPKNIAEIVYCKNWAMPEINPDGLKCEYKLGGGHFFKRITPWLPD